MGEPAGMVNDQPDEADVLLLVHDFMLRLHARTDLNPLLDDVVSGVHRAVGFGVAVLNLVREDRRLEVVAVATSPQCTTSLVGTVYEAGLFEEHFAVAEEWGLLKFVPGERSKQIEVPEAFIPDFVPDPDDPYAWDPWDTLLAPLYGLDGELVGVLSVDEPPGRVRPSTFRLRLLELFAVQAGLAIGHAKRRVELDREIRLSEALHNFVREARQLELDTLLEHSMRAITGDLAADVAWMRVFADGEKDPERLVAYPDEQHLPRHSADMRAVGRAEAELTWARQRAETYTGHEDVDPELRGDHQLLVKKFLADAGGPSTLFVPVGAGSECLGFLCLQRPAAWTQREQAHATEIGRDLGRAILNARVFEREQHLVAQLQEVDDYKQQLISTISHELRNPLASILGHLEILGDSPQEKQHPSYAVMMRSAQRLAFLVDDLLMLNQVHQTSEVSSFADLDLGTIVQVAADLLRVQAEASDIELVLDPAPGPTMVKGDPAELDRMVLNLVSNAVKYTRAGGRVRLGWTSSGDVVRLVVSDSGIGISEADQSRLFEEFFRSTNPEALAEPGTGLGLRIVARVVERHGGTIELTSSLGEGTTVEVTLPLARTSD